MAHIVLINPRFEVSFWGMEHALPLLGKRANLPVACLPLLAALTPAEHTVTLLDENVEPIDFDRVARADVVGITGMIVQRRRMREILGELKRRGAFTVVGGPWVSVQEDYFGELADVIFVGEAEQTWPQFCRDWERGDYERRYEQTERTDMTQVPTPRFDLLRMRHYLFGSVQFSRGCPFQCEFCDIIVTFGRRPRLKTSAQIIAELEALRAQRMRIIFIVDDNLIGNKRAIKELLRELIAWQRANGYPMVFFTEASLDLAEDAELLRMMVDANIVSVFIGIETPNEASLRETKKLQNLRSGRTILDRIHTIQQAGIEVWSGMILGFDHDDSTIFRAQCEFIHDAHIVHAMVGMLHAIPKTPLYDRLARQGRLDSADDPEFGTNVIPERISRAELRTGYVQVMNELHRPESYFQRLDDLYLRQKLRYGRGRARYWRKHPWSRFKTQAANVLRAAILYARLMRRIPERWLRREYHKRVTQILRHRRDPALLALYLFKCAIHYHHHTMARQMARGHGPVVNSF